MDPRLLEGASLGPACVLFLLFFGLTAVSRVSSSILIYMTLIFYYDNILNGLDVDDSRIVRL
jgi:hypothetical protein